jgi:hypothetical protein
MYAAVNVNSVPQTLDTYSTLGKKIEGQISTLFYQGLNIISPGTHLFLRFEGSELTIIPCYERKARYSTPVLLVTNKYYSC